VALALRLHGSPTAREALAAMARDPRLPASLREEIRP
jgi:hypothetical protein